MFCDEGLYYPAICLSRPSHALFYFLSYKVRKGIKDDDRVKEVDVTT
jgi:hypothetical protein